MATILAIDPGTARIGMVLWSTEQRRVIETWRPEEVDTDVLFDVLKRALSCGWVVLVEKVQAQRLADQDTIDTADQAGWILGVCDAWGIPCHRMYRREVKKALDCAGGTDAVVAKRCAEILVGKSDFRAAQGTKSKPGPAFGVLADARQALGLCLAWLELNGGEQ